MSSVMTSSGKLVVLTSLKQTLDHSIVRIDRKKTADQNNVHMIAGGPYAGIIVNRMERNAQIALKSDVSISFNVSLTDNAGQKFQEKRQLHFQLEEGVDIRVGKDVVHKFFRALLTQLPKGYICFLKQSMVLLKEDFLEIKSVMIDFARVKGTEQISIPELRECDSPMSEGETTIAKVRELLERAYPNGLLVTTVMYHLKCTREEAMRFLGELESSGHVKREGNEWVRVDGRKTHETVELNRRALVSMDNFHNQPTIAIISCLFEEKQAIDSLISNPSTIYKYKSGGDSNVYTLGTIGAHRVVATKLAVIGDSREETTSAGSITTRLLGSYPSIEHVFIVGVGGAVPHFTDASRHARLGDVIVSTSHPHQYVYAHNLIVDRETEAITGFAVKTFDAEDNTIEEIVLSDRLELLEKWNMATKEAIQNLSSGDVEWTAPHESTDVLALTVADGKVVVVPHPDEERDGPRIHLGAIAAMATMQPKHDFFNETAKLKEEFLERYRVRSLDAGFEPVVSAVQGNCIKSWCMVRGIADYSNGMSRAGKLWQAHAAVRAATMTRCLIERIPTSQ